VDHDTRTDSRLFSVLWDHSPIPQAIVSKAGDFIDTNPAWSELLGYSRHELSGKNFSSITHPGDIDADKAEVRSLVENSGETGYSMVKRYLSKQGTVVWVELHVFAIRGADSHLEYFAICAVPLPSIQPTQSKATNATHYSSVVGSMVGVVRNNPRECLVFCIIALVAVGKIPYQTLIDSLKHIILP
jgi:PAS domain S-box-containing protein